MNASSTRLCRVLLVMLFCCAFFSCVQSNICVDGICQVCAPEELSEDYCIETQRKMSVLCGKKETWRGCEATPADEQVQVLIFLALMAVCGALAYWGVKVKKSRNLSLFDTRKKAGTKSFGYLAS